MFLLFEEALAVRSSNSILFFKKDPETLKWVEYHKIDDMRGTIYFIKGNIRIQITTETKVYFYIINKKTFMPELENVMMNFMKCSSLLFGARVRFGIAFKVSQPDFTIFTRKCYHNFKVCIDSNSFEGAVGVSLAPLKIYAMAHGLEIGIYDQENFQCLQKIDIQANRDDVEVLYIQNSQDYLKLGVVLGKRLIKGKIEITELLMYKRDASNFFFLEKQ